MLGMEWKKNRSNSNNYPPSQPKEKNGKQSEKKEQKEGEERTRAQSPGNSALLEHLFTRSPQSKEKRIKEKKKKQKQGREGSNPLIWRPTVVNRAPINTTAVKRYQVHYNHCCFCSTFRIGPKKTQISKFTVSVNGISVSPSWI